MFTDRFSDIKDLEESHVKTFQIIVKAAPTASLVIKLQEKDAEEWTETCTGVCVT
jgi:hypothetical protein